MFEFYNSALSEIDAISNGNVIDKFVGGPFFLLGMSITGAHYSSKALDNAIKKMRSL